MVLDSVVGDPIYTVHDLVLGDLLVTTSVLSVDVSTLCDHASDYADVIELRLAIINVSKKSNIIYLTKLVIVLHVPFKIVFFKFYLA